MVDETLKPALLTALRVHEIGNESPYELSFAGKGNSGASFGAMQGDLAAGQPVVQQTFRAVLQAAGFDQGTIDDLVDRLSVHLIENPLSHQETARIDAALQQSRNLVDAMDAAIAQDIFNGLDSCTASATQAGRSIAPVAMIYMALWINMSGPPTKLLTWLRTGQSPVVDEPAIQGYLRATAYYEQNPGNWPHLLEAVAAGRALLPQLVA